MREATGTESRHGAGQGSGADAALEAFIARWGASAGAERANYQLFLAELFLGKLRIQSDLGEGYAEALRAVYADEVPDSADYVMYWWDRGARLVSAGAIRR